MKGNYILLILFILILSLVSITSATLSSPSVTPDTTVYTGDVISVSWNGGGTPLHWSLCSVDTVCQNEGVIAEQTGAGTKQSTVPSYTSGKWFVVFEYYASANHYHWYISSGPRPTPVANFTMSNSSGVSPLLVNFTDASTYNPTSWNWTFGGANFSDGQNPNYTFVGAGNYTVTLNVSNASGSNKTIRYVNVNYTPTPNFTMSNTTGKAPLLVNFTDDSLNASSWNWSFGDGNYSNARHPNYTYTSKGTYTITLNASNNIASNNTVHYAYVYEIPIADFTIDHSSGSTPLLVTFTDTSTNTPTTWNWSFGDGNYSILQNPSYTYISISNYTVILNASNIAGWDNKTQYVNVTSPPPIAEFTMSNEFGYSPLLVNFIDTSTNTPTTWNWSFNGSNFSDNQNPNYIFNGIGNYTVILNVSNYAGWDNVTHYVNTSTEPPSVSASVKIQNKILDTQAFMIGGFYLMIGAVIVGFIATLFGTKP